MAPPDDVRSLQKLVFLPCIFKNKPYEKTSVPRRTKYRIINVHEGQSINNKRSKETNYKITSVAWRTK